MAPALGAVTHVGASPLTGGAVMQLDHLRDRLGELAAIPLPGHGATIERWRFLMGVARSDLAQVRLVEGHLDAVAILDELGRSDLVTPGEAWGVWAAEPHRLVAARDGHGWRLRGTKGWCSGSVGLDRALVTATADDGPRLFAVDPIEAEVVEGSWNPIGMAATASHTMDFDIPVDGDLAIGRPGSYVDRAGFWHGGAGVAACWYGGADAVLAPLAERVAVGGSDIDALALGRIRARLLAVEALLERTARLIDENPTEVEPGRRLALATRLAAEDAARSVLDAVNVALGAGALRADTPHSRRVADLTVYLRQLDVGAAAVGLGRISASAMAGRE